MIRMGEFAQGVYGLLEAQGLYFPEAPDSDIPILPKDLGEVSDADLMVLFSEFTAWTDHLTAQVAAASVDERAAERRLAISMAKHLVGAEDRKVTVTSVKAAATLDPEIIAATDRLDTIHAYRKMVEVLADNCERDAALISRELTRRTASTVSPTRRSGAWAP